MLFETRLDLFSVQLNVVCLLQLKRPRPFLACYLVKDLTLAENVCSPTGHHGGDGKGDNGNGDNGSGGWGDKGKGDNGKGDNGKGGWIDNGSGGKGGESCEVLLSQPKLTAAKAQSSVSMGAMSTMLHCANLECACNAYLFKPAVSSAQQTQAEYVTVRDSLST